MKEYSANYFYRVMWFSPKNSLPKQPVAVFNFRREAEDYILTKENPEEYKAFKDKYQSDLRIKTPPKLQKKKFESRSHRKYSQKSKNK